MKVTGDRREDLWDVWCEENFGASGLVLHPVPMMRREEDGDRVGG